jgi:phenylacetate-CoA ligase
MNSSLSRVALRLHEKLTGRRILVRLEELNRTQWLSRDELLAMQQTKLQRVVDYAYRYVPYYRRTFDAIGFQPADLRRDPACLAHLPTLSKAIIRDNWQDMLTTEPERRRQLSKLRTSGSTGEPLVFMQDRDFRDYVTAECQRHLGWAGWQLGELQAFMGEKKHAFSRDTRNP